MNIKTIDITTQLSELQQLMVLVSESLESFNDDHETKQHAKELKSASGIVGQWIEYLEGNK